MKRIIVLSLALLLASTLSACGGETKDVTIDYGESAVFSREDIDNAAKAVFDKFSGFDGCTLYSLTYAGDEKSKENIEYCNSFDDASEYTRCIVFDSLFRSPKSGGGSWRANSMYEWSWYLASEADGEWVLLTYGYA